MSGPLHVALSAALLANLLDAATTWVAIGHYQAQEVSVLGAVLMRAWGVIPTVVVIKGSFVLLTLAFAAMGTEGEPRWWRVRLGQRWMITAALWLGTAWFGYLAIHNAIGMWIMYSLNGW